MKSYNNQNNQKKIVEVNKVNCNKWLKKTNYNNDEKLRAAQY